MRNKKVTIKDVAKEAGVGVGTVSRVLNAGSVNLLTRERVMIAIQKLKYKPNIFARQLAGGKSRRILALMPEVKTEFHWRILEAFDSQLDKFDYQSIIYPLTSVKRYESLILNPSFIQEVEGIVIFTINPSVIDKFWDLKVPVVLIEQKHSSFPCVFLNNFRGGQLAAQHLILKEASDFFTLYSLVDNPLVDGKHMEERLDGFKQVLNQEKILFSDDHTIYGDFILGPSNSKLTKILTEYTKPGIFSLTDNFALVLLQIASSLGKIPGKDFLLIGYDNQSWTEKVGLTTIEQPIEDFGETAAQIIIERIRYPQRPVRQVEFNPRLILRSTT
jgi:LacI family transcriptional regulator